MLAVNILIKIREFIDLYSDFVFCLIGCLRKFSKKDVIFICDKLHDCENVELIDGITLFENALDEGKNAFYLISKDYPDYRVIRQKYGKRVLKYSSNMHIKHFFKFLGLSKFLTTFELKIPYHKFLYEDADIDLVFVQHGPTLLKKHVFDLYNQNEYNKMVVSNDIEADIVKKNGKFKDENIIKAGLPRYDKLIDECNGKEKNILLFFTWRLSFGTIDYKKSLYYQKINSLLKNESFQSLLKENKINLKIAIHHSMKIDYDNVLLVNSREINSVIKKSDLLITDYSSVWGDFFFLNKPVIFYRPDIDDKQLISRDREDIEFALKSDDLLFNITSSELELITNIQKYINNNFSLEPDFINKQNSMFYYKKDICKRILEQV